MVSDMFDVKDNVPDYLRSFFEVVVLREARERERVIHEVVSEPLHVVVETVVTTVETVSTIATVLPQYAAPPVEMPIGAMIRIYNRTFGAQVVETPEVHKLLVDAFETKFRKNLNLWMNYCELIKTSDFLMGKVEFKKDPGQYFKLSIGWCCKPSNVDRIFNGEFGINKVNAKSLEERMEKAKVTYEDVGHSRAEVLGKIHELTESEPIKEARIRILNKLGYSDYVLWFHWAKYHELGKVEANNLYAASVWDDRFKHIVKDGYLII